LISLEENGRMLDPGSSPSTTLCFQNIDIITFFGKLRN
jgi:hypothetical protein